MLNFFFAKPSTALSIQDLTFESKVEFSNEDFKFKPRTLDDIKQELAFATILTDYEHKLYLLYLRNCAFIKRIALIRDYLIRQFKKLKCRAYYCKIKNSIGPKPYFEESDQKCQYYLCNVGKFELYKESDHFEFSDLFLSRMQNRMKAEFLNDSFDWNSIFKDLEASHFVQEKIRIIGFRNSQWQLSEARSLEPSDLAIFQSFFYMLEQFIINCDALSDQDKKLLMPLR